MKKRAKKIMALILVLAFLGSLFGGFSAFALTNKSLTASISSNSPVAQGSDVTITASAGTFANIPDGIIGYTVKITYDSTNFTFVTASETKLQGAPTDGTLSANKVIGNGIGEGLNGVPVGTGILYLVYLDNRPLIADPWHPLIAGNLFSVKFTANSAATLGSYDFAIAGINTLDNFGDTESSSSNAIVSTFGSAATVSVTASIIPGVVDLGSLKSRVDPILGSKSLFNIEQGTTVAAAVAQIHLTQGVTITVTNMYSAVIAEADYATTAIGTGTTIDVIYLGNIIDTYTAIVYGDLDGDGFCGINDASMFWDYICLAGELTNESAAGADIYWEGSPSLSGFGTVWDYVCLVEGIVILQNPSV